MIGLALRGLGAAQAALGADGDRRAARRGDDRRHLRADRPDPRRLRGPAGLGLQRRRRRGRAQGRVHAASSAGPSRSTRRWSSASARSPASPRPRASSGRPAGWWSTAKLKKSTRRRRDDRHAARPRAVQARHERRRPACPSSSGEVALLRDTADKHDLEPGDQLGIATRNGRRAGHGRRLVRARRARTPAAPTSSSAPLDDMQRWFDREGEVTSINVAADEGVSPEQLVERIQPRRSRDDVEVRTGDDRGRRDRGRDQRPDRRLPDAGAARVRRRRAARRRVHHLQHVHDHRRRAHARVRAAAHARRDARGRSSARSRSRRS